MHDFRPYKLDIRAMQAGEHEGVLTGYATVFRVLNESYAEIIDAGSFDKTLAESGGKVPLCVAAGMDHNQWIGMTTSASADRKGIEFTAQYVFDVQLARENWALAQAAFNLKRPAGMSQTFQCITDVIKNGVRHVQELRWLSVSVCMPGYQSLTPALATSMRSNGATYNLQAGLWQPADGALTSAAPVASGPGLDLTPVNAALDSLLTNIRIDNAVRQIHI